MLKSEMGRSWRDEEDCQWLKIEEMMESDRESDHSGSKRGVYV